MGTTLKPKSLNLSSVRFHAAGIGLGIVAAIVLGTIGLPQSSLVQPIRNRQLPWRSEAPNITLRTASEDVVELKDLRGTDLALVFVTPTCQYSQDLKRELIETEKELPVSQLIFISGGSAEANDDTSKRKELAEGFAARFSVLQDTTGEMFRAYQINGVPSAYWISDRGHIVDFAVGFGPSLRLLGRLENSR